MSLNLFYALSCKVLYKKRFEECTTRRAAAGLSCSFCISWLDTLVPDTIICDLDIFQNLYKNDTSDNPWFSVSGHDNITMHVKWKSRLLIKFGLWNYVFEPIIWAKASGPWWDYLEKMEFS